MPRKPDPLKVPQKRGPKKALGVFETKGYVLEERHMEMIAAYRASHPQLTSDSAVVRLAIETLCGPAPTQEEEKEE